MNKSFLVIILLLLALFCLSKNKKKLLGGQVGTDLKEVSISLEKKTDPPLKTFPSSFKKKAEEEINSNDKIKPPQPLPKSIEEEYLILKKQYEMLKENYKELKSKYDRRGIDYKNLKNEYNSTKISYKKLKNRLNSYEINSKRLNEKYDKLVKQQASKIIQKYDYNRNDILDNKELQTAIMNNDI